MAEREQNLTKIKKMPDKRTLEEFIDGTHGKGRVVFNRREGKFERVGKKDGK